MNSKPSPLFYLLQSLPARGGLLLAAFSSTAYAHPGHSLADADAKHLLTSPYHLIVLGFIGLALWAVGSFVHRNIPRRILQLTGGGALLSAVVLWGLRP
ncbi:MAG TPA: hypothetical protein VGK40_07485 [Verrucomicrobiae bacterium]